MPRLAGWSEIPEPIRRHLTQRMAERDIQVEDLYRLKLWVRSAPEVPSGAWFKDFGTFKLCGYGSLPKAFLLPGQAAKGNMI